RERRRLPRRAVPGPLPPGQEPVLRRGPGLERGLDPTRPAHRRRPLPDRRPGERGREPRPQGAAEAARQPDLARRLCLRRRVADRAVAGRTRGAAPGGALRGRDGARMSVALVVGALLAVASVVLVAAPFLREPAAADDRLLQPDAAQQRQLARAEERDRALDALKELEFDHRTGKVSDEDYRVQVGPLRQRAAAALREADG